MDYKFDFLQNTSKKSRFQIILGLLLTVASLYILIFELSSSTLGLSLFYIFWGLGIFFNGLGFPPERLIGKKFILINEEKFHFKFSLLKKGLIINTGDISSVELWPGAIILNGRNEKKEKIDLRELDPQTRHDTLMAIASVAKNSQISYKKHGYLEYYK
ncbi:MAG: hypothetical protein EA361_07275 [Bacteroidetes bacterium]|nr:MAG: hypothetical protein EA361_07275 [Bacteroidota bacterium]